LFGRRYGPASFARRDFGSMGSNYEDILKNLEKGTNGAKFSTSSTSSGARGFTMGSNSGSSGGARYTTSNSMGGGSYGSQAGKTYVRTTSTGYTYGNAGSFRGNGTVIGGD
jgi:hypothetical protein